MTIASCAYTTAATTLTDEFKCTQNTQSFLIREDKSMCPDNIILYLCLELREVEEYEWTITEAFKLMRKLYGTDEFESIPVDVGAVAFITYYPATLMGEVNPN